MYKQLLIMAQILILIISQFSILLKAESTIETLGRQAESDPIATLPQVKSQIEIAISQNDNDSHIILLNIELGIYATVGDMERMIETAKRGSKLAKKLSKMEPYYTFQIAIADAYAQSSKWLISKKLFIETIHNIDEAGFQELSNFANLKLGQSYSSNHEYSKALEIFLTMYDDIDPSNTVLRSSMLSNIALVYEATGEIEKAIEYYHKDLEVSELVIPETALSIVYYNLGYAYARIKKYIEAELYLKKSEKIAREHNIIQGIGFTTSELGALENVRHNYEKAYIYLEESYRIALELKVTNLEVNTSYHLLETLIKLNKLIDAEKLADKLEQLIDESSNPDKIRLYMLQADLFEDKEDYFQANSKLHLMVSSFEKRLNDDSKNNMREMQAKFNHKIQEQDNLLLTQQNQLQQLKITEQLNQEKNYLLLFSGLILLLVFTVLYLRHEKKIRLKFTYLAMTDELTGVSNRRKIMEQVKEELTNIQRYNIASTIAVLDLDFFKKINDNFGHDVGDIVLKEFAKAVEKVIRKQDLFGRIGGEEWLLLFPNTDIEYIQVVFDRINNELATMKVESLDTIISFSMGVSQLKKSDQSMEEPIKRADSALYQAKENGRNCYVIN